MGMNLSNGIHVLRLRLLRHSRWSLRQRGRVVVHDLPRPVDLAPHVREASLHRRAALRGAGQEGVHARVQVGVIAVALNIIRCDGAVGELLEELHEVLLGRLTIADELGGDGGEEGEVLGGVEAGDLLEVLLLEGVVPGLEVGLKSTSEMFVQNAVKGCSRFHERTSSELKIRPIT